MICYDRKCNYRELNGGDEISDFYYCKYVGMTVDRGQDECLIDQFDKELNIDMDECMRKIKEFIK